MTIQHHISDELLLGYASGTLAEGWSIAVATHLALCPSCRRRLDFMEHAGGEVLEMACSDVADDSSWAAMKARLGEDKASASTVVAAPGPSAKPTKSAGDVVIPEPLRSYLGGDLADLKWKALGRGAYHIRIPTGDREPSVRLLRIPAGKPVPEHSHGGRELTLVLKGSFQDGEALFRRGDLEEADESLQHQPVATPDEDCICLAVTDAPLKFRGYLMRLVQPVLGI
jgi:putative transcriptional regulator